MLRLYVASTPRGDEILSLPAAQFAHVKARRCSVGDEILLFDGSGQEWQGRLHDITKRDALVEIGPARDGLGFATPEITLALSVIAADRMDWAIQKCCELGVARIVPLLAQRSQAPGNAANKTGHWQSIAAAAAEQCGRATVTKIAPAQTLTTLLSVQSAPQVWLMQQSEAHSAAPEIIADALVCIGPEGGWTAAELVQFQLANAFALSLSHATLRAETAAIVAVAKLLT